MKKKKKHNFIMRHRFVLAVIGSVLSFVFACAGLVVANAETAVPDDAHIVVLFKDGIEKTVLTRSDTVGALVDKLQIKIGEFDLLEPAKDAIIGTDNFKIQIRTAVPTTIITDGKVISLLSPHTDTRLAVTRAGVSLAQEDEVIEEFSGSISDSQILGRKLVVRRAISVRVVLYGAPIARKTQSNNVAGVLREMNINPTSSDSISPSFDSSISNDTSIFITKQGIEVQAEEKTIGFTTETIQDAVANAGTKKNIQKGIDGKMIVFFEINKSSGEKIKILETVIVAPVIEIVSKGTKPIFASYTEDGIPARVFCGSPKQGTWKNINVANAAIGRVFAQERDWTGPEFDALLELFACESSWNEKAGNPYSGAYGIPQSWPANKMASFGEDYETNPTTQLRWGLNYIAARYGTPSEALAFHYRKNYY